MPFRNALESILRAYRNLSERERKMVLALGLVFLGLLLVVPAGLLSYSISSLESENEELGQVLRDIRRDRALLETRQKEARCMQRRYEQSTPALGSFLEAKAKEQGLAVREITDEPQQEIRGFTRSHVRVTLTEVDLRSIVDLMVSIETSPFPVAINEIQIDHSPPGDKYTLRLGVVAFARQQKGKSLAIR
jgi:type II secretory pathway component PulM